MLLGAKIVMPLLLHRLEIHFTGAHNHHWTEHPCSQCCFGGTISVKADLLGRVLPRLEPKGGHSCVHSNVTEETQTLTFPYWNHILDRRGKGLLPQTSVMDIRTTGNVLQMQNKSVGLCSTCDVQICFDVILSFLSITSFDPRLCALLCFVGPCQHLTLPIICFYQPNIAKAKHGKDTRKRRGGHLGRTYSQEHPCHSAMSNCALQRLFTMLFAIALFLPICTWMLVWHGSQTRARHSRSPDSTHLK